MDPNTAINLAAHFPEGEFTVQELLAAGADPNFEDTRGFPLFLAASSGNLDAVNVLIAAGADINKQDSFYNYTPLMISARNGHAGVVDALIAAHADPNIRSGRHGDTALHLVAHSIQETDEADEQYIELVLQEMELGDLRRKRETAFEIAYILIYKGGANPNIRNYDDVVASDLAPQLLDMYREFLQLREADRRGIIQVSLQRGLPANVRENIHQHLWWH